MICQSQEPTPLRPVVLVVTSPGDFGDVDG
jgi:hypothetical protein